TACGGATVPLMMMRGSLILLACLAACGPAPRPPGDDDQTPSGTLSISPAMSEQLLVGGAPASQQYTAMGTGADGVTHDVTSKAAFAIDNDLGTFVGSKLSITSAGHAGVHATLGDQTATADVIARLFEVRVDPSLPANAPDLFTGPESPSSALT